MSGKKPTKPAASESAVGGATDTSLETVRDILFGAQSREFEERFAALESRLKQSLDELGARVDENHRDLKSQLESLRKSVEQDAASFEKRVDKQFDATADSLTRAKADLESAISTLSDDTESHIAALNKSMKEADESLAKEMDALDVRLQDRKLDRRVLGTLLTSLASEISKEDAQ